MSSRAGGWWASNAPWGFWDLLSLAMKLNTPHKTARIESAFRVELMLHGAHERERVAGISPGIESAKFGGALQKDKRAFVRFRVCAQFRNSRREGGGHPFQAQRGDTRCLRDNSP